MIYLQLFFTFFKIGIFSFGGGYGMIPLIERELEIHNWLTAQEFVRVISISEMTPGPIAVNTATLVGYNTAGFFGGASATLGVVLPSLILILASSHFLYKHRSHPLLQKILSGIKPVILALIIVAIIFVGRNTMLREGTAGMVGEGGWLTYFSLIDPFSITVMALSLAMLVIFKINPIFMLLASGAAGVIFYYLGFI